MTEENNIENKVEVENENAPKVHWEPVAKPEVRKGLDPYEDAPQAVKDFHNNYCNMWLRENKGR